MLTPAHIASSYLLSQTPILLGTPLTSTEVLTIIVAGNILDLDFILGSFFGKKGDEHHNFITHTPIFILIAWIISLILLFHTFSSVVWILILISALLHLILDDVGYWFCRFGWQEISKYPQINWFYPLTPFTKREYEETNKTLLKNYLRKAKVNIILEVGLIISAAIIFMN